MVPTVLAPASESSSGSRLNVVAMAILVMSIGLGAALSAATGTIVPGVLLALGGAILMQSPRVAQQWERAVVLRLGRFVGLRGTSSAAFSTSWTIQNSTASTLTGTVSAVSVCSAAKLVVIVR
jgi:hypothetical protein